MSTFSRLEEVLTAELDRLRSSGTYKEATVLSSPQGPRVTMNGREVVMLSSNNYLGLAADPAVLEAARNGLEKFGHGTASVRFICGTTTIHGELEREIADFLGVEAALTYMSCWDANVGLIPALIGPDDAIFSDALNHASIIDAIRLSKGRRCVYPHRDVRTLARLLEQNADARLKMIVTDGVFSMEGDLAPLPDLCDLAEKHGAFLVVDESHATGVLGDHGRGTVEHFGLDGRVTIQTSTLGKTLGGACGGYVAGPRLVIDYLLQRSRPHLFSNALPPSVAAGSLEALRILRREPERLTKLRENTRYFRERISELGLKTIDGMTPIVPVIVGETALALRMQKALLRQGIYVSGFGYPVVPKGEARLRCQISSAHERVDLDLAVEAFRKVAAAEGLLG